MTKKVQEGLADLAQKAEHDHEVQMARADLYKIAKYAIKLHDMLKNVSESEGLEGWQQAKITKASDYISSVYHNLDYDMKFGDGQDMDPGDVAEGKYKSDAQRKAVHAAKADKKKVSERKMTKSEKSKETKLKKKYDDSDMKKNMKKQYGKDGESVYYATIRKKAMESSDPYKATIAEKLNKKLLGE